MCCTDVTVGTKIQRFPKNQGPFPSSSSPVDVSLDARGCSCFPGQHTPALPQLPAHLVLTDAPRQQDESLLLLSVVGHCAVEPVRSLGTRL